MSKALQRPLQDGAGVSSHSSDRLRIALVAPPWYPVPPRGYGGIELVVYLLAQGLGELGHEITVFGRQGPRTDFELVVLAPKSWSSQLGTRDHAARECTYLRRVYSVVEHRAFDVIHDHAGYVGMLLGSFMRMPVTMAATLHGDLTEADSEFLAGIDAEVALVAISNAQKSTVASVVWAGVVHNAIDIAELRFSPKKDAYLLQVARISPDKGQHLAIEVARRAGRQLILAGKVDESGREYFEREIEPHLGDQVRWISEVRGKEKATLLARAHAMLYPMQWEEPFGLAMAEAMASGTPVLATPRGAAPEIVEEGVTGFLADDADGLVAALGRVPEIDSSACCETARRRFSPRRMAEGYEAIYRSALNRRRGA